MAIGRHHAAVAARRHDDFADVDVAVPVDPQIVRREELARLGIDPARVDTISYGRDRPIDTGHAESSHRKNRRGEFVLLTPPK